MTDTKETTNELETDEAQKVIQETEGPLKAMLVNYVGSVLAPEDGQITVNMIIETLASEFPEFLLVVARENWLRGYEQALTDVDNAEKEKPVALDVKSKKSKSSGKKKKAKSESVSQTS
tara:strand:+ start:2872 stop:3228 length:357 start_codon:yes stop_codon:yes gene_type:complete